MLNKLLKWACWMARVAGKQYANSNPTLERNIFVFKKVDDINCYNFISLVFRRKVFNILFCHQKAGNAPRWWPAHSSKSKVFYMFIEITIVKILLNLTVSNKMRTYKVGAISKAQKAQIIFFKKLETFEFFFRKMSHSAEKCKRGTLWDLLTFILL